MNKFYFLVFILYTYPAKAQFINVGKFTALGNASVAVQGLWSANANAAGLSSLNAPAFAAAYENPFSVRELSNKSAVAALPLKNYVLGGSYQSYGIKEYTNHKISGSLARKFGHKLAIALSLNYHQLHIENFEHAETFSVEAGVQYQVLPKLRMGAHIANPNQSQYSSDISQHIQSHIKFGMSYLFSNKLFLASEIEKIAGAQMDFKLGIDYQLVEILSLRGGITTNTFKQYGGFGLLYKKLDLSFAVSSHPVLGYSPQIALGYEF